jgi:hypothetical protein
MALLNKNLGNLYQAVSGSSRAGRAVSISGLAGGGSNISFSGFSFDSASATLPFTYIVENTTENVVFSFSSAGTLFNSKVKDVSNNYQFSISPGDGAITFGTNANGNDGVKASTTKIGVTNISNGVYGGNTAYMLTAAYNDGGWSQNQDGFNRIFSKEIYNVDSYNSINSDVLCVDINTLILLSDGSEISAEDLYIGDVIKTYVPTDMPEWLPENDTEDWYWWYQTGSSGEIVNAAITNVYYSFVDSYISINDDLLKCTHAHPLFINDSETNTYQFVRAEDITIGDKLIKYNKTTFEMEEIEVVNIETKNETLEIATITVDVAHTYLSNGFVSHNKGSNTAAPIPSANLVMYLDPEKAASYSTQGQQVWFDLTGKTTGLDVKSGAASPSGDGSYSVAPTFNNTTPKSLTFPGGAPNYSGARKQSSKASGTGISNFACTTAGATFVWWQNGNSGQSSTFFRVTNGTQFYSINNYGNPATTVSGLSIRWPGATSTYFLTDIWTVTGWNMYAISFGPTSVKLYQNNILIHTTTGEPNVTTAMASPTEVSMTGNNSGFTMGPALFYNTALGTTELTAIWNNLRGRFGK